MHRRTTKHKPPASCNSSAQIVHTHATHMRPHTRQEVGGKGKRRERESPVARLTTTTKAESTSLYVSTFFTARQKIMWLPLPLPLPLYPPPLSLSLLCSFKCRAFHTHTTRLKRSELPRATHKIMREITRGEGRCHLSPALEYEWQTTMPTGGRLFDPPRQQNYSRQVLSFLFSSCTEKTVKKKKACFFFSLIVVKIHFTKIRMDSIQSRRTSNTQWVQKYIIS